MYNGDLNKLFIFSSIQGLSFSKDFSIEPSNLIFVNASSLIEYCVSNNFLPNLLKVENTFFSKFDPFIALVFVRDIFLLIFYPYGLIKMLNIVILLNNINVYFLYMCTNPS